MVKVTRRVPSTRPSRLMIVPGCVASRRVALDKRRVIAVRDEADLWLSGFDVTCRFSRRCSRTVSLSRCPTGNARASCSCVNGSR